MKLLAIETATEACSAALYVEGRVTERYAVAPREHNRLLLPMIDSLLAELKLGLTDLDALAFGRGPGAFTGLRIAAGVAQGIAFAAELPVVPVSCLAALALDALTESDADTAFPCIDARMGEIYWAVYRRDTTGTVGCVGHEQVVPPERIEIAGDCGGVGIGSGWQTYEPVLRGKLAGRLIAVKPERFPRAASVALLGADYFRRGYTVTPEEAVPVYLRDRVVSRPGA